MYVRFLSGKMGEEITLENYCFHFEKKLFVLITPQGHLSEVGGKLKFLKLHDAVDIFSKANY